MRSELSIQLSDIETVSPTKNVELLEMKFTHKHTEQW